MIRITLILSVFLLLLPAACQPETDKIATGADQTGKYIPLLRGKRIAVVANQTSLVDGQQLVDTLLRSGINVTKILAPEHGFRGSAEAGELFGNASDPVSGLPVISLYGDHKKPAPLDLEDIDMLVFDLQDVGVRCYTYLSTLHLVMEACAEAGLPVILLDRPNPLGGIIDGPVLEPEFRSFVGMHPIPLVHGMTLGELARMINGEGWLSNGVQCDLTVIPCSGYKHSDIWELHVKPSPNLPNNHAVMLYPSLVLFEGTVVSVGRGTAMPFEVYGNPQLKGDFTFTPGCTPSNSRPKFMGEECRGEDLRSYEPADKRYIINLKWLINAWDEYPDKAVFFNGFFDKLAGTAQLREQIMKSVPEEQIRESWKEELEKFRRSREKYLLYSN